MTHAEIILKLKTKSTAQSMVEWFKETLDEEVKESFLSGYQSGNDAGYSKGFHDGVNEMKERAMEVIDNHLQSKFKQELFDQEHGHSGQLVPSAIN